MKLVINSKPGGCFCLSVLAMKEIMKLKGIENVKFFHNRQEVPDDFQGFYEMADKNHIPYITEYYRTDKKMVSVVEKLGEKASMKSSRLKVVEIPNGIEYRIESKNGDGKETVVEIGREWE